MNITKHIPKGRAMIKGKAVYSAIGVPEHAEFSSATELLEVPFVKAETTRAEFERFEIQGISPDKKLLVAKRIGRMPVIVGTLTGEGVEGLKV
jgi:hypothetical protein